MFYSVNEETLEESVIQRRSSLDKNIGQEHVLEKIDSNDGQVIDGLKLSFENTGSNTNIENDQGSDRILPSRHLPLTVITTSLEHNEMGQSSIGRSPENSVSDLRNSEIVVKSDSFKIFDASESDSFSSEGNEILDNAAMQTVYDKKFRHSLKRKSLSEKRKSLSEKGTADGESDAPTQSPTTDRQTGDPPGRNIGDINYDSKMIKTDSFNEIEAGQTSQLYSLRSKQLLKYVDSSIGRSVMLRKNHYPARKRYYIIALFVLIGVFISLTIFSQQVASHSKDDDKPETSQSVPTQQDNKMKTDSSPTAINNAFDTSYQIVMACIEKSENATKSCAEMCESKRCCFEEFDCPTIMTQRECSVYAGCLSWLQEERYMNKVKEIENAIDELMNTTAHNQTTIANIWIDSGGRKFSANLLLEACNEDNIKTQNGHDNCLYLCQQSSCCFVSSSIESCSNEEARCQVFSPCENVFS